MGNLQTYLLVGVGGRGLPTFGKGLLGMLDKSTAEFPNRAKIVGLMDANIARCRAGLNELRRQPLPYDIPIFDDLQKAIVQTRPDWVIVCTPDRTHVDVCLTCLEHGANLIVEKPLATSVMECDAIINAAKKAGRTVRVAHNCRYYAWAQAAARMIREGRIGRVLSFEAIEVLDNRHGADYFHRWHSDFDVSGGMMCHKGCHHFDLINWMLSDRPVCVSAFGSRTLYVDRNDIDHADRCCECKLIATCQYSIDTNKSEGIYRRMYRDSEHVDGYVRDLCVYSDRHTIYDNYFVNLQLSGRVFGRYTLLNFGPEEFVKINVTGTEGRLEAGTFLASDNEYVTFVDNDGRHEKIDFTPECELHGHGDADIRMLRALLGFGGGHVRPEDLATAQQARDAILAGDLANRSLAWGGIPVYANQAGRDMPPAPPQPAFWKISPSQGVKLSLGKRAPKTKRSSGRDCR